MRSDVSIARVSISPCGFRLRGSVGMKPTFHAAALNVFSSWCWWGRYRLERLSRLRRTLCQ